MQCSYCCSFVQCLYLMTGERLREDVGKTILHPYWRPCRYVLPQEVCVSRLGLKPSCLSPFVCESNGKIPKLPLEKKQVESRECSNTQAEHTHPSLWRHPSTRSQEPFVRSAREGVPSVHRYHVEYRGVFPRAGRGHCPSPAAALPQPRRGRAAVRGAEAVAARLPAPPPGQLLRLLYFLFLHFN